jgi:hypothetical protein
VLTVRCRSGAVRTLKISRSTAYAALIAQHCGRATGLRVRVGDTVVQGAALFRVTRANVVPAAPPGDATDEGTRRT